MLRYQLIIPLLFILSISLLYFRSRYESLRESCNSILDRTQLALDSHSEFNDSLQAFDDWMSDLEDKRTQVVTLETLKDRQAAIQVH